MNNKLTVFLLFFISIFSFEAIAQEKKKLDYTVYDTWHSISGIKQSQSGNWVSYEINPGEGDGILYIESTTKKFERQFSRGKNSVIHYNEKFVVFTIEPQFDSVRTLKLDGIKKDKLPKDSIGIYRTEIDSLLKIPNVKSFKVSEEGDWMAYHSNDNKTPDCPEKKCKLFKKKNPCVKPETSGTTLTLLHPETGNTLDIHQVIDYEFSRTGNYLAYVKSDKGKSDTLSLYVIDLSSITAGPHESSEAGHLLISGQLAINSLKFDYNSHQLVFLTSSDTNKRKNFELAYWSGDLEKALVILDSNSTGMPEGHTVSEFGRPYFSRDGSKIYIGTNKIVRQEPEDTLLETEKAKVDVWSWDDSRIQPQQLHELRRDQRTAYTGVYFINENKFVQIEDEEMEGLRTVNFGNANFALGISSSPYYKERTWQYPWRMDVYYVDLKTGNRELINKRTYLSGSISPTGDFYVWYDAPDSSWCAIDLNSGNKIDLTSKVDALFYHDNNGAPTLAFPEGSSGWTKIDDKEYYIVDSEYDIWLLDPSGKIEPQSLTSEMGIESKQFLRIQRLDYDSIYVDLQNVLIHGTDDLTKAESYAKLFIQGDQYKLEKLIESDHKYIYFNKAKNSSKVIFRRMSFTAYPEIESSDITFSEPEKLTETNPQQSEYNWGTVELVSWKSFEGRDLRGLLYKPEDFDSTKSYPMIVYYYEKYTDNLHNYYAPKPTASIVYPTEYVSNGYIIFIPDILYTPGHPAKSAYDCIVSGTDYLLEKHSWIDSTRLGLQGQSWGGYQTAQLITMTDKYAAAMAGAPVSNMFSAYGGVRWGSGYSRMFQYERTQSRIGYTIWERPDLYIENSPIFGLPNVSTPLLIMHNDGDGAVPWYQGIELYMGMRRLGKPAWMLNYNGDEHNLMKTANRKDLSIRMRQFFDHYLLGAPMPVWMKEGVPATDKGIDYGLEYENSGP